MKQQSSEKRIDDYVFNQKDVLGSGSYSVVYKGRKLTDDQVVAIKVVNKQLIQDPLAHDNMKKEIKIMGSLDHPNIIKFHCVFQTVHNIYIIMDYCNEGTLLSFMRKNKKLPEVYVWKFLRQIVDVFKYLLEKKVLHRDIKPQNILLANGNPKLIDFGFACYLSFGINTVLTDNMGSPLYMSPQLLLNQPYSPKSDIWSLGILIYEMMYGRTPWPSRQKQELIHKTLNEPLKFQPGPSKEMINLIVNCIRIRESQRLGYNELFQISDKVEEFIKQVETTSFQSRLMRPTLLADKRKATSLISAQSGIDYKRSIVPPISKISSINFHNFTPIGVPRTQLVPTKKDQQFLSQQSTQAENSKTVYQNKVMHNWPQKNFQQPLSNFSQIKITQPAPTIYRPSFNPIASPFYLAPKQQPQVKSNNFFSTPSQTVQPAINSLSLIRLTSPLSSPCPSPIKQGPAYSSMQFVPPEALSSISQVKIQPPPINQGFNYFQSQPQVTQPSIPTRSMLSIQPISNFQTNPGSTTFVSLRAIQTDHFQPILQSSPLWTEKIRTVGQSYIIQSVK